MCSKDESVEEVARNVVPAVDSSEVDCPTGTCCPCTGDEKATFAGEASISSYTGDFPSPLQAMWYVPDTDEVLTFHFPDSEIRSWIKEAADYHGIPHSFLAVILQQENGPNTAAWRKFAQFAERSLTTFGAIVEEATFDVLVWDRLSKGSSGFANMSHATLRKAAIYTEQNYCKNPLSSEVRYRIGGWDQDTRIPGDDWKADLYYTASHIRELVDRETGQKCYNGPLTIDQARNIFGFYNGSGDDAAKYADDARSMLEGAMNGTITLYFYEK
ncbi:MAG: hypothetical protein ACK5LJ_13990 [Paracoccus sp. (in: a-proteobacteria)]